MSINFRHFTALFFSAFLTVFHVSAQDRFNVDSIKAVVRQLSSDSEKVKTYIDMASIIYCEDSISKITIAKEAKKLAESIKWRKGIYNANRKLGQIYFDCLKNYPKAFESFEENVAVAQKFNDTINEAKALETIAKYYKLLNEHQKSLEYFNMALAIRPGADMQMGIWGDEGVVFSAIADYSDALTAFTASLDILDSLTQTKTTTDLQDTLQRASLLLDIGDIYLSMSNPDKAFDNYDKALDLGHITGDMDLQIMALTGIGKTYRMKSDYQRAIDNYKIALGICQTVNKFRDEVNVLTELANTYLDTWVFAQAESVADSARRLAEDQSYIDLLPKTYITSGNVYIKQNKFDLAIPYLQKALNISQKTSVLEDQKDAWQALTVAYAHNGDYAKALDANQNYHSLKDSIFNIARANEFLRKDLENSFRQTQMSDSLKNAYFFTKKIERQRMFTYYGFAGLMLVLLLAFFMFRNYNIQKKYNELLSREKKSHLAHIEAQSNVLSDIAHIQAHQVRGPVATILGLVQLFNYDDPTDPINKEVMEGLGSVTEKLDTVVKEVILKENRLRYGKDQS